ncbi:MAG: O-antigen ligase family protein, partial [Bacteroidetes bacterium]|nr:O-antigen ligase family protein [Bacteroidota bacterium]
MIRTFDRTELGLFTFLGAATVVSVLAALFTEQYYLALIPFGLLTIYVGVINFKLLYYLLLFTIPFSIEYSFSESLATDLPDEPLMIGLMFVTGIFVLTNYKALPKGYFGHLLLVALMAHLFWIFISALTSIETIVSFKVFLSKIWYTMTFSVLTAIIVRTKEDLKKAFWCIYIPLTLLIIQVIIRHAINGFAFDDINQPMAPFFRNHVNYAAIVTIFFPFILLVRTWYEP